MTTDEFLEQFIEGYLFEDLQTMSQITPDPARPYGAVGYPMLMTIMSGMELLGGLLVSANQDYKPRGNSANFKNFWDKYFSREFPKYATLGGLVYQLVRNGIAHSFIAKHGIVVNKLSQEAIELDSKNKELHLNPNELYYEFKQSYVNRVKPIFLGESQHDGLTVDILQQRINTLDNNYHTETLEVFNNNKAPIDLSAIRELANSTQPFAVTGAMGPVDSPAYTTTTTQTTRSFPRSNDPQDDDFEHENSPEMNQSPPGYFLIFVSQHDG